MKDVAVIAGGKWQAPIVRFLKSKGHKVHIVNPVENATTALADNHIKMDIRDVQDIFTELKKINPVIVTSDQSDVAVVPTAILAQSLNVKGIGISNAVLFTDKLRMSEFALQNDIPTPAFDCVTTPTDIVNFCRAFKGPYVLKPVDANASRGFVYLDQLDNLQAKFAFVLRHSHAGHILIQTYAKGTVFILDGICSAGKHKTLTHSRKWHFREGISSRIEYPSGLHPDLLERVVVSNDRFVERSGLEFGITHAEYIIDESTGEYWLLEIAARGGGAKIGSHVVQWVSGVDVYEILYDNLRGATTNVKEIVPLARPAVLKFYEYQSGTVRDILGIEEANKVRGVCEFATMIEIGQQIKPASNAGNRHAVAIIFGETKEEIASSEQEVEKKVRVIVE